MTQTIIHLQPGFFESKERVLVEHGPLTASAFRFDSSVAALRLKNEKGELVMLPFQGQQVWSVAFGGRNLTMKTPFTEPRPTRVYLETYGGFLLHCGATAMGVPTGEDTHPLHGELPNAPYQKAAEPEGYHAEKAKGNVRTLAGGESARFEMEMGYLTAAEAAEMEAQIKQLIG
jgi:hypothetical protein